MEIFVFWAWHNFDCGGMHQKKFGTRDELAEWLASLTRVKNMFTHHTDPAGNHYEFADIDDLVIIEGTQLTAEPENVEVVTKYSVY